MFFYFKCFSVQFSSVQFSSVQFSSADNMNNRDDSRAHVHLGIGAAECDDNGPQEQQSREESREQSRLCKCVRTGAFATCIVLLLVFVFSMALFIFYSVRSDDPKPQP